MPSGLVFMASGAESGYCSIHYNFIHPVPIKVLGLCFPASFLTASSLLFFETGRGDVEETSWPEQKSPLPHIVIAFGPSTDFAGIFASRYE